MWVFDGETWREEDGSTRKSEEIRQHPLHDIATPELMVVDVPLAPREPVRRPARNRERSH